MSCEIAMRLRPRDGPYQQQRRIGCQMVARYSPIERLVVSQRTGGLEMRTSMVAMLFASFVVGCMTEGPEDGTEAPRILSVDNYKQAEPSESLDDYKQAVPGESFNELAAA